MLDSPEDRGQTVMGAGFEHNNPNDIFWVMSKKEVALITGLRLSEAQPTSQSRMLNGTLHLYLRQRLAGRLTTFYSGPELAS